MNIRAEQPNPRENQEKRRAHRAASRQTAIESEPAPFHFSLRDASAVALVLIAFIAVLAVLNVGRVFFLPIVTGFVIGTMLAPATQALTQYRIPRAVAAVLIVFSVFGALLFIVALISAPLMDWSQRLPEVGAALKDKVHILDRPLALWQQAREALGETGGVAWQLPKIEWVQPTVEFLSPTLAQIVLFFATLVLFLASWPGMRRAAIMIFRDRDERLRTLRILNSIEAQLGSYLLMVTGINIAVGVATGIICAATSMPNPAGLGALAATLNYIPILGPVAMFGVIAVVGLISFPAIGGALLPCILFAGMIFVEGHFITPTIIGRRLQLNALVIFLGIAFWTWLWGPMGAFLSSPILIVFLVLKEHLWPSENVPFPDA